MLKYDLIRIVRPLIIEALETLELTDFEVLDHNQFTKQQLENHTITFQVINDRKVGFRQSKQKYDHHQAKEIYTQKKEVMMQLMCFLKEDVSNLSVTSQDILNRVSLFFEAEHTLIKLLKNNVGFARGTEVKQIPIRDEGENYIIVSSLDLVFVVSDSFDVNIQTIQEVNQKIERI